MRKIGVRSLPITLVQFLKWGGFAQTGSDAKALVREGMVRLNGEVCSVAGRQLALGDIIEVANGVANETAELCLEADQA